jgi:hypothetical protein
MVEVFYKAEVAISSGLAGDDAQVRLLSCGGNIPLGWIMFILMPDWARAKS